MKWQCFDFIVPAGLLWVFPELSVVRCKGSQSMHMDEEMDICGFGRVLSTEAANEV
jgi:hypothetical protein